MSPLLNESVQQRNGELILPGNTTLASLSLAGLTKGTGNNAGCFFVFYLSCGGGLLSIDTRLMVPLQGTGSQSCRYLSS